MAKYRVLRVWPSKTKIRRGQVVEDPPWRNLGSLKRLRYIEEIGAPPVPEDRPKKVVEAEAKVKEKRAAKAVVKKKEKPNGRTKNN